MSNPIEDWTTLAGWARDRFKDVDTIPALVIPWPYRESGPEGISSGLMVDFSRDRGGEPEWRLGIYADLGYEDERMVYFADVDSVVDAIEYLTEEQPEGTDWLAWVCQRVDDGWPEP